MVSLGLEQITLSTPRSIQLKEWGNDILHSLCTDPSSKGGKGLCNYEPKLAEPSRNLFWRPRNESLNSTDSFFPSGILSMAFISLFSNFSCKVLSQGQKIVSKTEDRLMKINAYFDKLF